MTEYELMASIRVSSNKSSLALIERYVAERVADKDREISRLMAILGETTDPLQAIAWNMVEEVQAYANENKRLREGIAKIQMANRDTLSKKIVESLCEELLK